MTFLERVENTLMLYFYVIWFEVEIRWKEQELLEKKFGRALPSLEEVGKNASVILVNTHHSLNGVRVLPPSVVEVGGIHIHNRTVQPLPPDLEQWVSEAKSDVILFSFGSLVKGSTLPKKRLHFIVNVFRRLPHRIIWKWEADEAMEASDNVRLMRWLPQYDLLHHPNCVAFISHAGLLSPIEAVATAVPMLAIPILGDQFGNAAHAKIAGVAEVLPLRELDEESFEKELMSVLEDKMRNQAKRLSKIWKDNPMGPMDKAVYNVENIARHGGSELSSRARSLNRFQLALLDIFAFLLALIVTMYGIN